MPVQRCQIDGKDGYRWGSEGKCYTGPDARERAAQQGRAIEANKSLDLPPRHEECESVREGIITSLL